MRLLDEIMRANRIYLTTATNKPTGERAISKEPRRKIAIFTCMDTRLIELLEPAMGISRGDAHILKNAGNTLADPNGGVVRSLVVSVYTLDVEEILVVGHQDCGMARLSIANLEKKMLTRGIPVEALIELKGLRDWIGSFADPADNVRKVTRLIRASPLIPRDVPVHGLIIEPDLGALSILVNGYLAVPIQQDNEPKPTHILPQTDRTSVSN